MTEPSENPHHNNTRPGNKILYTLLVIVGLLVADFVIYLLIFRPGSIPIPKYLITLTQTEMKAIETPSLEFSLNEDTSIEPTQTPLSETPAVETPDLVETPIPPILTPTGFTPAFGSCQYTLGSAPRDFLYAIYWNWHINKNIPDVKDYYSGITCAPLVTNLKCDYQADHPGTTQPGWTLILPGVSLNICLFHGGTFVQ